MSLVCSGGFCGFCYFGCFLGFWCFGTLVFEFSAFGFDSLWFDLLFVLACLFALLLCFV